MFKTTLLFSSTLGYLLFTGCAVVSDPIYPSTKRATKVPAIKQLDLLTPHKTQKTEFSLVHKGSSMIPDEDNYVNTASSKIDLKKFPTIVIALPVERNAKRGKAEDSLNKTAAFKTEGYLNKAEPNVEKELMRFGFNVIDRSKFEAKLRTLRDSTKYDTKYYRKQSEIYDEKVSYLKQQKADGKISAEDYFNKLSEADLDSRSRKVDNKEIVDMSELIRAAQSNGVKADYILQLNEIVEYSAYQTSISIKGLPEIKDYMSLNPDLEYGTKENNIPSSFPVGVYQVVFGAKLINVQSGKVQWVGTHELNSLDIESITASFSIIKEDISTENLNTKIQVQNNKALRVYDEAKERQSSLNSFYKKASIAREYKNESVQTIYERSLKQSISANERTLTQNIKKIKDLNLNAVPIKHKSKFSYYGSQLVVSPDFNVNQSTLSREQQKRILKHRQKLLNKTIRSLLNTIKVK